MGCLVIFLLNTNWFIIRGARFLLFWSSRASSSYLISTLIFSSSHILLQGAKVRDRFVNTFRYRFRFRFGDPS